jgi:hypothetical protein
MVPVVASPATGDQPMTDRIKFASLEAKTPAQRRREAMTKQTFPEIAETFAPYHTLTAFQVGAQDYMDRRHSNPYGTSSVDAQAWDRGAMAASLFTRQFAN